MIQKRKKKSPKPTEFCSAVVKSGRAHFACMKRAVAVHEQRGFCKKHAPAFKSFNVFRISSTDGSIEKVRVFRPPTSVHYHVISPQDRLHGRMLWPGNWHRSIAAARKVPLKKAQEAVRDAKQSLTECQNALQKIRGHKS